MVNLYPNQSTKRNLLCSVVFTTHTVNTTIRSSPEEDLWPLVGVRSDDHLVVAGVPPPKRCSPVGSGRLGVDCTVN